jgi:hypothetical protein
MAFQWIFNNATSISVNKKAIVGQTITRNQTVRAVSRGNSIRRFTVQLPDGMPWSQVATYIQAIDAADRFTKETIQISNSGYNSWINAGDINTSATYQVICVELPQWTISERNLVTWSGPFVFFEALV